MGPPQLPGSEPRSDSVSVSESRSVTPARRSRSRQSTQSLASEIPDEEEVMRQELLRLEKEKRMRIMAKRIAKLHREAACDDEEE